MDDPEVVGGGYWHFGVGETVDNLKTCLKIADKIKLRTYSNLDAEELVRTLTVELSREEHRLGRTRPLTEVLEELKQQVEPQTS